MMFRPKKYFVGDFETTVYDGQSNTEVWASALVELGTEDVKIYHTIDDTFDFLEKLGANSVIYYHNLKFDGSFWMNFLLRNEKYTYAVVAENNTYRLLDYDEMPRYSYSPLISDRGQWYSIVIKFAKHTVQIRDSLKLLPFSVEKIGKSFATKHKKLDMVYTGYRYAGCNITEDEKRYIANDVLVVKEALELMIFRGHNKTTIGSCCLAEYKKIIGRREFDKIFPPLTEVEIDNTNHDFGADNWDRYIRNSYRGGWCYLVPEKAGQVKHNGLTYDVNSLYPSMMHSVSGNYYPIGQPSPFVGHPPDWLKLPNYYYFCRIRCSFDVKSNKLPFIQIKHNLLYRGTENLTTSKIFYNGQYFDSYERDGEIYPAIVELTLSCTDLELFFEHYNVDNLQYLDGVYFRTDIGIFDEYIDKYMQIKMDSKGAERELAKLYLNNLYGKLAANNNSSFKICYLENGILKYKNVSENNKKAGYIPVGAAITSYARRFTITHAQANYYGADSPGFIYADTDSIHCDLDETNILRIEVDAVKLCCWKLECKWDEAIFTRQKTYIEHVIADEPYYDIKCAGMQKRSKELFIRSLNGDLGDPKTDDFESLKFLRKPHTLNDFAVGLTVPGRLKPKQIEGGIVLLDDTYTMR